MIEEEKHKEMEKRKDKEKKKRKETKEMTWWRIVKFSAFAFIFLLLRFCWN
jgi:quinol-cytochrome oxidoreductase complex cytochrome b subunit